MEHLFFQRTPTSKLPKHIPSSASKTPKVSTAQKQTTAKRSLNQSKDDVSDANEQVTAKFIL